MLFVFKQNHVTRNTQCRGGIFLDVLVQLVGKLHWRHMKYLGISGNGEKATTRLRAGYDPAQVSGWNLFTADVPRSPWVEGLELDGPFFFSGRILNPHL